MDNEYVKVWCNGILDNPDENANLANGEIPASGNEPTCEELKANGYVGIQNGKCYGKEYNKSEYVIQCDDTHQYALPTLIILNGVDPQNIVETNIKTRADADDEFRAIYRNAQEQRQLYFKD